MLQKLVVGANEERRNSAIVDYEHCPFADFEHSVIHQTESGAVTCCRDVAKLSIFSIISSFPMPNHVVIVLLCALFVLHVAAVRVDCNKARAQANRWSLLRSGGYASDVCKDLAAEDGVKYRQVKDLSTEFYYSEYDSKVSLMCSVWAAKGVKSLSPAQEAAGWNLYLGAGFSTAFVKIIETNCYRTSSRAEADTNTGGNHHSKY